MDAVGGAVVADEFVGVPTCVTLSPSISESSELLAVVVVGGSIDGYVKSGSNKQSSKDSSRSSPIIRSSAPFQ